MIKMSTLIEKTMEAAKAEAKTKIQNGYKTVLKILTNDLQGAEMLPGGILKIVVDPTVGDEFNNAIKDIGSDVLNVGNIQIWRSTTSRGVLTVDGINPSNLDEDWEALIDEIKDRSEMI